MTHAWYDGAILRGHFFGLRVVECIPIFSRCCLYCWGRASITRVCGLQSGRGRHRYEVRRAGMSDIAFLFFSLRFYLSSSPAFGTEHAFPPEDKHVPVTPTPGSSDRFSLTLLSDHARAYHHASRPSCVRFYVRIGRRSSTGRSLCERRGRTGELAPPAACSCSRGACRGSCQDRGFTRGAWLASCEVLSLSFGYGESICMLQYFVHANDHPSWRLSML